MDHHRAGPMANLFSNINMGAATRPFDSSGRSDRGAHTGAHMRWCGGKGCMDAAAGVQPSSAHGWEAFVSELACMLTLKAGSCVDVAQSLPPLIRNTPATPCLPSGRGATFWNLHGTAPLTLPSCNFGSYLNLVLPRWRGGMVSGRQWQARHVAWQHASACPYPHA